MIKYKERAKIAYHRGPFMWTTNRVNIVIFIIDLGVNTNLEYTQETVVLLFRPLLFIWDKYCLIECCSTNLYLQLKSNNEELPAPNLRDKF
jgi:hypothetical protein